MYDVFGIGNALVDHEYMLSDGELQSTQLIKGNMTLVDLEEQQALLNTLKKIDNPLIKQASGGSAANSVYAFASLGGKAFYNCRVGDDEQGKFYLQDLQDAGVSTSEKAIHEGGITGSCVVAVTPDAERTMQTYLGTSADINDDNINYDELTESNWLYLEGYLAMSANLLPTIGKLRQQAGVNDVKIAVSFADPAVIKFAKDGLLQMIGNSVDLVFCNLEEAQLFTGKKQHAATARALTEHCRIAVVTNGADGAIICRVDEEDLITLEVPTPFVANVLDTNGAGDSYAGAFLYGLTQHYTLAECGRLAGAVSSQVIQQMGPRLDAFAYQDIARSVLQA